MELLTTHHYKSHNLFDRLSPLYPSHSSPSSRPSYSHPMASREPYGHAHAHAHAPPDSTRTHSPPTPPNESQYGPRLPPISQLLKLPLTGDSSRPSQLSPQSSSHRHSSDRSIDSRPVSRRSNPPTPPLTSHSRSPIESQHPPLPSLVQPHQPGVVLRNLQQPTLHAQLHPIDQWAAQRQHHHPAAVPPMSTPLPSVYPGPLMRPPPTSHPSNSSTSTGKRSRSNEPEPCSPEKRSRPEPDLRSVSILRSPFQSAHPTAAVATATAEAIGDAHLDNHRLNHLHHPSETAENGHTTPQPTSPPGSFHRLQQQTPHDRYICESCNKAFSRPSSLRIHSHSHTGEKPFICPQKGCGKAFSVRSNMKRHEKGCHAERERRSDQGGAGASRELLPASSAPATVSTANNSVTAAQSLPSTTSEDGH